MLKQVEIRNFKSIEHIKLDLGRINVFIGENGAGKSNILEALAFAGAASADKLDGEFLASRGIRMTSPQFMRSAFVNSSEEQAVSILLSDSNGRTINYNLEHDDKPYSNWKCSFDYRQLEDGDFNIEGVVRDFKQVLPDPDQQRHAFATLHAILNEAGQASKTRRSKNAGEQRVKVQLQRGNKMEIHEKGASLFFKLLLENIKRRFKDHELLADYVIYSPENSSLRIFEKEGQISPLGINGEGLNKLLYVMTQEPKAEAALSAIKEGLRLFDWFDDFEFSAGSDLDEQSMLITDRFIKLDNSKFDQRSASEGFLFVCFYFALFTSEFTPKVFAIDNVDASLNPKMCAKLTKELFKNAKVFGKQAFLTTHNPSILDGVNIDDDEQKIFVVSRSSSGKTRVKTVKKLAVDGDLKSHIRLSEAFVSGLLGGLPKSF